MPKLIAADVLDVLLASTIDANSVTLPPGQLDRSLYVEVNKVLTNLGGKWNRTAGVHLFPHDPTSAFGEVLETGRMPVNADKLMSFWRTPRSVAERLVDFALDGQDSDARVLEPSAGDGAIAEVVREMWPNVRLTCVEQDPGRADALRSIVPPQDVYVVDLRTFAAHTELRVDAAVMNPPFTEPGKPLAWVEHVTLAFDLLAPGGRLAAIVPSSIGSSTRRPVEDLRMLVEKYGSWEMLPAGSFKESGTGVNTAMVAMVAP